MNIGYFLVISDMTTCGGYILTGDASHTINGLATARVGDLYKCGKDNETYQITGGQPNHFINGVQAAGTAHSTGTCSCRCRFINSIKNVTYGYENESRHSGLTGQTVVNNELSVAPQNTSKPLVFPRVPSSPVEEEKSPREPVDAGFCVLPYEATPSSYESLFFINPPDGTRELYHKLNPDMKKQPGSILIVVDPEKQDQEQIETLQKARDRIDAALEPLTVQEAKLLHDNRGAVDAFSYKFFADNLSKAGDGLGYISEIGKSYYDEINRILVEIEDLYKNTYNHNNGVISGQEFFGQRIRLFKQLDLVLTKFSKAQLNLSEYQSIKRALGLSTRTIMHRWDRTGVDNIEGYATYIEKSVKLMQIMKTVGYVGIGLDFASYTSNVYDACSKGRENECRKAAITEYSKFGFKQIGSAAVGSASGWVARGACMWVLGLASSEIGAVGAGLCLVTGVGASTGAAKLVEGEAEDLGESFGGNILYEKFFK